MKRLTYPQQFALEFSIRSTRSGGDGWMRFNSNTGPYRGINSRTIYALARRGIVEINVPFRGCGYGRYKATLAGVMAWTMIEQKRKKST